MDHVDIQEVAVRDNQLAGEIEIRHIPGPLNNSVIFTKEMRDTAHCQELRGAIMSQRTDCSWLEPEVIGDNCGDKVTP